MEELRKEPVTAGLILLNILVFLIVEFTGSSQNTIICWIVELPLHQ